MPCACAATTRCPAVLFPTSTLVPFALLAAVAFVAMEVLAYVLHRWVFHGPLWRIHRTHHDPARHGRALAGTVHPPGALP